MSNIKARVGLARRSNRRDNIFHALDLVRDDVTPRIKEQVLLKPNFLSGSNQLASSHVDVLRGTIDFLLTTPNPPKEIIVAEGGNEDYSGAAFDNFNYHTLHDEYDVPIKLVDLNQETQWQTTEIVLADGSPYQVHMPKTVLDAPCTISLAIAKTHDVCVVTLALKNMIMGTIRKIDRVKMHGFQSHADRKLPDEAKVLNINLIRLAQFLTPDVAVVDGTRGLQGNGPGGEDGVDLGIAAAGVDVYATDAVMAKSMGFEPLDLGLLHYGHLLELGVADLKEIEVLETKIADVQKSFKPHETTELQFQWQRDDAMELLPA
ncbi:MAG: DUF362 domain-containing protein [Chloroflexota bacterium]